MSDWLIEWVIEWVIEWLSDWVSEWVCEWVSEWRQTRGKEWERRGGRKRMQFVTIFLAQFSHGQWVFTERSQHISELTPVWLNTNFIWPPYVRSWSSSYAEITLKSRNDTHQTPTKISNMNHPTQPKHGQPWCPHLLNFSKPYFVVCRWTKYWLFFKYGNMFSH